MNAPVKTQNVFSLAPTTFEQAMQFSNMVANSDLAPKDYKGKPENVLIAMQMGAEVGLQPMQAVQNIAVINGRPTLWGDAMLALVRASGLLDHFEETYDDKTKTATCKVKRKGFPLRTETFSMEDAKTAGLVAKQGPWTQYPRRMQKMRARSWALRDDFTDILKGLRMAEEELDRKEYDVIPVVDDLPKHSGSAALKDRIAKKNEKTVAEAEAAFDLSLHLSAIDAAQTNEELKSINADEIDKHGTEEQKLQFKTAFKAKQLSIAVESVEKAFNEAQTNEEMDNISVNRLAPLTDKISEQQLNHLNSVYDQNQNRLNA